MPDWASLSGGLLPCALADFLRSLLGFCTTFPGRGQGHAAFQCPPTFGARARHGAGFEKGATGFYNQAHRGGLQLDERQSLVNIREPWRFVAVRWTSGAPILGNASSALRLYANKTNSEAPCSLSWASILVPMIC